MKLAARCAKGEHCAWEMTEKMRAWGLDDDQQQRVLDRLVRGKYVDDERYSRAFIHDKIQFNGWGRYKIAQALRQKHIDQAVYGPLLDAVDDEEYLEMLRPLVQQKWKTITARNDYERSMKLIRYAMSRGFDISLVRKCIDMVEELPDD